jgi:hypothetical protein
MRLKSSSRDRRETPSGLWKVVFTPVDGLLKKIPRQNKEKLQR